MTRDQELWATALWVEKHHGKRGPTYIAKQISQRALKGDEAGVATWRRVSERFDQLGKQDACS